MPIWRVIASVMADMGRARAETWPGRVLVTGAGGFVGGRLVRAVKAASAATVVLPVRGPWAQPGSETDGAASLDLTDAIAVDRLVQDFAPDVIVHLAAFSSVGQGAGRAEAVWSANFDGTRAVATAARGLGRVRGTPVRLVFASTAEVYGLGFNDGPRDEGAALAPASTYSRSKAACEYLLRDMADDALDVIALRLFNHTGPGQTENFVVPALAAQLARLKAGDDAAIRVGNLEAWRDFSDVDDIIDAYLKVLSRPGSMTGGMSTYNVGSGRLVRVGAILDTLIARHGTPVEVIQDPARMRPSDVPQTPGVFEAFKREYDWQPTRDFQTTIADIYDHEAARASVTP